ncbi:MAG: molybdopterin molybdenumtransferase MoeA [Planctomycetes bacterium]|nr:molybdopterin molybdenumtransferase MoeA [Planctomycetota bacterium]
MLTYAEAMLVLRSSVPPPPAQRMRPLAQSLDCVLARDVLAEMDLPPFEKSSMDGWAVRADSTHTGETRLRVAGRILAGDAPGAVLAEGSTWKIMTGAPLPVGANAVVMVEKSSLQTDDAVLLHEIARPGQNVCHQGEDLREGEVVLRRGTHIDACALAVLASVGADPVPVHTLPRVAVIPTGDELVSTHGPKPLPGQIRESNGALLEAQLRSLCVALTVVRCGIARDEQSALLQHLDVGLGHDVLLLSGGVSMGDADLVPLLLRERGMEVLIEKVAIKPGKPMLFGRVRRSDGGLCHVFGLPGNPVSTLVTFEIFVRPFLLALMGLEFPEPRRVHARLGGTRALKRIPRLQHVPCSLRSTPQGFETEPLAWHGSADLRGVLGADGLMLIDIGEGQVEPGAAVEVHVLDGAAFRGPARASRGA